MKYLSNVGIGLILIALVAATVGTILFFQSREDVTKAASPPPNWQKFTDPKAGYSFYYPPNSSVQGGTSVETGYLTTTED